MTYDPRATAKVLADIERLTADPVPFQPPTPAETLELADQLDDHGGLDEKDVAQFLRDAVAARAPVLTELAAAGRPTTHEHIWTTTSPTRCVQCRHYLTPWWRRTLNRLRRLTGR